MNRYTQPQATVKPAAAVESIASRLTGVWTLMAFADEKEGHEDAHPLGAEPIGILIYTADGFMSAQLMRTGRSPFRSREWLHGTPEEYAESGSGYVAYSGTYEVDEERRTVTHIPSVALVPNLIDDGQLRSVELNGDRLVLRAAGAGVGDGVSVRSRLEWRRIANNPTPNEGQQHWSK